MSAPDAWARLRRAVADFDEAHQRMRAAFDYYMRASLTFDRQGVSACSKALDVARGDWEAAAHLARLHAGELLTEHDRQHNGVEPAAGFVACSHGYLAACPEGCR